MYLTTSISRAKQFRKMTLNFVKLYSPSNGRHERRNLTKVN